MVILHKQYNRGRIAVHPHDVRLVEDHGKNTILRYFDGFTVSSVTIEEPFDDVLSMLGSSSPSKIKKASRKERHVEGNSRSESSPVTTMEVQQTHARKSPPKRKAATAG